MADIDEQRSAIDRDTYEMHTAAAPRATLATAQERNRFHAIFTRRSAGGDSTSRSHMLRESLIHTPLLW